MKKLIGLLLTLAMVLTMAMVAFADGEAIKVGVVNNPPSESGYREANVNDFINVSLRRTAMMQVFTTASRTMSS